MGLQNLENEKIWYDSNPWVKPGHLLNRWPFVHPARAERAYRLARAEVRTAILRHCESHGIARPSGRPFERALVAPCGTNADQDILLDLADEFHGIDLSETAVRQCPSHVVTKVADILDSGYEDGCFDLVASILFFHHLHRIGFEPFLREFHRVLKPGGVLAILEPSAYYPFGWLMKSGRKVFGNVTGQVPDEAPVLPSRLTRAMVDSGFSVETFRTASFSHNRLPVPVQGVTDLVTAPLRNLYPLKHMGWMCVWVCTRI